MSSSANVAGSRLSAGLPANALGLGLRPVHLPAIFASSPEIDYFEVIAENFLHQESRARAGLRRLAAHYRVVIHGVGLNLLGHMPLDERYLDALCRLADEIDAPFLSDHLCWTGAHGIHHHDLLPLPYVEPLLELAAERAAYVQKRLGRPFGIENLSSYVEFRESTMSEWEFYTRVVRESGTWFMLDLNNIYVSSVNHGFVAEHYVQAIEFSRVLQVHLAGHTRQPDGILVDTHDQPVSSEVWQLYAATYRQHGPFPTLLEWDAQIPPLPMVIDEIKQAVTVRQ